MARESEITATHDRDEMEGARYSVVVNEEGQYSIWLADKEPPSGWSLTGKFGAKAECLAHIDEIWIDMRPRNLKKLVMRDC